MAAKTVTYFNENAEKEQQMFSDVIVGGLISVLFPARVGDPVAGNSPAGPGFYWEVLFCSASLDGAGSITFESPTGTVVGKIALPAAAAYSELCRIRGVQNQELLVKCAEAAAGDLTVLAVQKGDHIFNNK